MDNLKKEVANTATSKKPKAKVPGSTKPAKTKATVMKNKPSAPKKLSEIAGTLPKKMVGRFAEHAEHVMTLRLMIIALLVALMASIYSNSQAPSELVVRIPPSYQTGVTMKAGEMPLASIYTDTVYIWLVFNTWQKNGEADAFDNLWKYQHFYSAEFLKDMETQYSDLKSSGHLNRMRTVSLAEGTLLEGMERVLPNNDNSWVVYLDMKIEEKYLGKVVKNVTIRYPLLVERYDVPAELNPLGLRIVGFKEAPRRIMSSDGV